jgi:hypothetical protein
MRPLARRAARRLDPFLARAGLSAARRLDPWRPHFLRLECPPAALEGPRYGWGRPRHARLEQLLGRYEESYRIELEDLSQWSDELLNIPLHPTSPGQPCWINQWLPGLDTATLYGFIRKLTPARYVEVGSGQSTMVVARARLDAGASTEITSIDPSPRAEVDRLCDVVIRQPLELADLSIFKSLSPGDMIFLDGSHRVFTNSDMVTFYFDILPELPSGVIVGIHDILWPDDYLPEWGEYWWSEQYVLGAFLLGGAPWLKPLLACRYASTHPELGQIMAPLWSKLPGVDSRGFGFWFVIDRPLERQGG